MEFAPNSEGQEHRRLYEEQASRRLAESTPFGITMVNVTGLWNIEPKQHVKICVVDTGYDVTHEDLPQSNVTGWHPEGGGSGVWNVDGHGHGTHCAGTIGAVGNNGREYKIYICTDIFDYIMYAFFSLIHHYP